MARIIAQVNIVYGYYSNTLERLNIEPGAICAEYVTKMDRKSHTAKYRKPRKKLNIAEINFVAK